MEDYPSLSNIEMLMDSLTQRENRTSSLYRCEDGSQLEYTKRYQIPSEKRHCDLSLLTEVDRPCKRVEKLKSRHSDSE